MFEPFIIVRSWAKKRTNLIFLLKNHEIVIGNTVKSLIGDTTIRQTLLKADMFGWLVLAEFPP